MSRIGNKPVKISAGVKVNISGQNIEVNGPKGSMTLWVNPVIKYEIKNDEVHFSRKSDVRKEKALHGLYTVLLKNMISGVTEGYSKRLELSGIGFRADLKADKLFLNIGYSHPIIFNPPEGIKLQVLTQENAIIVSGIDKQLVGEVAAKIRSFRPPEPYKAKGIKYEKEFIRRKAGKAAATAK